jgi:hypothetical protein
MTLGRPSITTSREPSLLHASTPGGLPPTAFYIDDISTGHRSFQDALRFLEHHLLPRIAWSMLKLSFKKLVLFTDTIEALGMVHVVRGIIRIKEAQAIKIRN